MRAPAKVGDRLQDVDTPALILDLDSFEKNLSTLNDSV
jgi:D-serine deaminase-like pyridoxal phosphate-dependent protein